MNGSVAVLGGGSLGLLLAGRLRAAGIECVVWTRTREQAARLTAEGLTLEENDGGRSRRIEIEAQALEDIRNIGEGIVLLAVKQTALTPSFLERLAGIVPPEGTIVLFQNGIGHEELLRNALPGRTLLTALTTEGALRINDTTVRHTGHGDIRIGDDGDMDRNRIRSVEEMLKEAGFSVFLSKQLKEAIMRKLLVNAVINPLTAILRVPNGELTATQHRLELMRALFEETFGILSGYGLSDKSDSWNVVLGVCEATRNNRSSMLQDVIAGRPTEIDSINGAISRMAAEQGLTAPWNDAVTAMVKAIY
ncbi:ketopantoate reductase family protein [Cohnella terricola]|uniref:2-dehydropantoate 2-reductase n=1 Tax=Cohnella terricola TaxID=1289167 RepID=A0A559JL17_9BACL|nr:2-dehydropantoate 2-reductase [Cohnella terricola]TVY00568.1 2-dehydropantoate 2-reductase [Cohnella terricola]